MWGPLPFGTAAVALAAAAARCGAESAPGGMSSAPAPATTSSAGASAGPHAASPAAQPAAVRPISVSAHLHTSPMSAVTEAGVRVLRDRAAWEEAWRELQSGPVDGPPPRAPAVDFAREMVVVVAAGEKPSGGHTIRVDATSSAADGALVLHLTRASPGPGCMTTMAITSPVDAVRVPRTDGAVRTTARDVVTPC